MEFCDNRSQLQREETIQKKRKKLSAKDDDDELQHSKKLGSEDGFVFSTRRVTRSASKQQQQQHGEGEKQKKPVCSMDWREMTDEELKAYKKKAKESEGFDVGEVPEDVFMNIIIPCELDGPASELRPYIKMAKKALVAYNQENGTEYKFVKHVRVNRKGGATVSSYFITFEAKDKKAGSQNFQTAVGCYRDIIDIRFCRVEKKLQEPQGPGEEKKGSGETSQL